ncbi:MAG TPA: S8 family serine peptidase [Anaerolineae bacterium]
MKKLLSMFLLPLVALTLLLIVLAVTDTAHTQINEGVSTADEDARQRAAEKIDEALLVQLGNAAETDTIATIVRLKGQADLRPTGAVVGRLDHGVQVYHTLQNFAATRQAAVRRYLDQALTDGRVTHYRSYFIFNGLSVTAQPDVIWQLALRDDVASVTADHIYRLQRMETGDQRFGPNLQSPISSLQSVEWNIAHINADDVWNDYGITGEGIVVANIDSGVQYDHPALLNQYAGSLEDGSFDHDYHWFDAAASRDTPYDDNGHGTHTMGTIVGGDGQGPFANDIGVAPGARWIAVKAFTREGTASASELHAAFEWLLAPCPVGIMPGDPTCDPARAPHVVNNSWGSDKGALTEFELDVKALRAAGIWPEFSAGNNGPGDGTVGSPASFADAFATGAIGSNNIIANFSSRGPSPLTDEIKPDVVAPGVDVRSSVPGSAYNTFSGTSMAGPHSVGVAALMLEAAPELDLDTLEEIIRNTAADLGEPGPDMIYGYGRIDALKAVQRLVDSAELAGTVRDESSLGPLANVTVRVTGEGLDVATTSNAEGEYSINYLIGGTYSLTATLYGYEPVTLTDVVVISNSQNVVDITMTALPTYTLSGHVYDAVDPAVPISGATITILDTPLPPVKSDANGYYELTVAEGPAVIEAAAFSYATAVTATTITANTTLDFNLDPLPPVLLVDDDEGRSKSYSPNVETHYFSALDANGYNYTYWDIELQGPPDFDTIRQYAAVVWFGGEFGRIKDISEAELAQAIMDYLDLGGRFLYVSQSHTFYFGDDGDCDTPRWGGVGPCPFTEHYLGLADWIEDQKADFTYGATGNPVGDGLGPIPMNYPPLLSDFTDHITPTISASLAFTATDDVPPGQINQTGLTVYSDTTGFKTVFMATPLEAMSAADAADVVYAAMTWFGVAGLAEGVTLAPAQQSGIALPGETVSFTLRLRNLSDFDDSFDLSLVDAPWPTALWDISFNTPITEIGPIAPGETADIGVTIDVPAGTAPGAAATSLIRAVSQSGTPFSTEARLTAQARMVYHVRDSDTCGNGVTFDWIDTLAGERWLLDDANPALPTYVSVPLPEPFVFYNQTYTRVYFNDHATLLFGDDNLYDDRFPSGIPPIPNPTLLDPNNAIYVAWGTAFWHPSDEDPQAGVYTYHDTGNGRNRFVITYYQYTNLFADDPDEDNMQVILDLDTYEIAVQYQTVTYSNFAVAGIENRAGTEGILYVNEQEPPDHILHDGLAVHYGLGDPPDVLAARIEPPADSSDGMPGEPVDYLLTLFNAGSISDTYTLEASGNNWPATFYDASFTTPITELGPLASCETAQFGVRVEVPAESDVMEDIATIRARSQSDTLIVGTSTLTTTMLTSEPGTESFVVYFPVAANQP